MTEGIQNDWECGLCEKKINPYPEYGKVDGRYIEDEDDFYCYECVKED